MSRVHANYYSSEIYKLGVGFRVNTPYLYSEGRYKTKITADDLSPWYLSGLYYGYVHGYLNTKGVTKLIYSPNLYVNHMFKDDFLYILYNSSSKRRQLYHAEEPYNEYVWGFNIPRFLLWAEHYSGYDTSSIWQQIEEKRRWFQHTYPADYKREVGDITDFYAHFKDLYKTELG